MGRIAGWIERSGVAGGDRLEAMLGASRSPTFPGAVTERALSGSAALGAVGARSGSTHAEPGLAAVVDGTFYDVGGSAPPANAARCLIDLYRRHGFADALAQINGDFAVALYDADRDTLWLGRDRFAIRPLYFRETADGFAFSSRPRALLALGPAAPDPAFVARFAGLHYRTFDDAQDRSPYLGIDQLPAATVLEVRSGRAVGRSVFWRLEEQPDLNMSEPELAARYRDLLRDAVRIRLRGADRPAFTLSGGMDSSSVLACAVNLSGTKQQAYSTVYDDSTYDESAEIRTMLDSSVEKWNPVVIGDPDPFSLVPKMIEANDEPVATATWLSHYLLCERAAADGVGTLFGGLGGDELNAGEYEYFFFFFADLRAARDEARLAHEIERWAHHHDHPIFKKSRAVAEEGLARLVDPARPGVCLADARRNGRYLAAVRPEYFDLSGFRPAMDHPFKSYLKNRTYQDIFRETAPCCLRAADRQTEAFGLGVIWPFFDHRLAELMFRVPSTLKIRDGVTKYLLREAMKGVVPEETRTRIKKTGWNAPAHLWFTGRGGDLLADLVHSQALRERGVYDPAVLERLLAEHQEIVSSGRTAENHMMFFWQLLNLECWLGSLEM